jgi:hypothetical protein
MGRRTRTLLPIHHNLLETDKGTKTKLETRKTKQGKWYNKKCRALAALQQGSAIRMRLPADKHWSLGTCIRALNNRSYEVEVRGKRYRRNRRHLRVTKEMAPLPPLVPEYSDYQKEPSQAAEIGYKPSPPCEEPVSQEQNGEHLESSSIGNDDRSECNSTQNEALARRSSRLRRPPAWHKDYLSH